MKNKIIYNNYKDDYYFLHGLNKCMLYYNSKLHYMANRLVKTKKT